MSCKNLPVGTYVHFTKSWYNPRKKINLDYVFKVKKENALIPQYEINAPGYFRNFSNCKFSQELTTALRENGFIVNVKRNESFLMNMINSAVTYTGGETVDSRIDGEIAIAYGHNKKIGFSSFDNDFQGYSDGVEHILWDRFGEFDKWSRCNQIEKKTSIGEIIKRLKEE